MRGGVRCAPRGPGPAGLGGQAEAFLDQLGDGAAHGVRAARVIVVVSRLCHSEAAKASLIFSSGYLCERMRLHGRLSRRKADAEPHDPGFHVTQAECRDCEAVVAQVGDARCVACGRSTLMKRMR